MTIKQAFAIAASRNCMIGRRRPGVYYVSWADASGAHEIEVRGKTVKCAVEWIEANR